MRKLPSYVLAGAIILAAALAQAQQPAATQKKPDAAPAAAEKPKFSYQTTDGKIVSPETLKGRIIIVSFWASGANYSVDEVPHLAQLLKDHADQGLAIVGISLDTDKSQMLKVAKDKNITWPQVLDSSGVIAKAWGVSVLPTVVVLSPEGEKLWVGHPAALDAPLEAIMKKFPTPSVLRAKALETLAEAAKFATDEKDPDKALAVLVEIPEALIPDASVTAAAAALAAKLTDERGLEALHDNPAAATHLAALAAKPAAKTQPRPVVTILSTGTKPAAIAPAVLDARLALAGKDRDAGRPVEAHQKYKWIVEKAPGTPQAEEAARQAAALEAAPGFAEELKKFQREQEAASLLWEASGLEKNGKLTLAREKYLKIITDYKGTPAAAEADKALDRLNK